MRFAKFALSAAVVLGFAPLAHAAATGADDSTSSAYGDGWQTGDNGGTGCCADAMFLPLSPL